MTRDRSLEPTTDEEIDAYTVGPPKRVDGPITLEKANPDWPRWFEQERMKIERALGARALRVEHVGSTAIPGLIAKPIIDIVLVVEDSSDESAYAPALEAAGYELRIREPGWFEHRMFKGCSPDVNLHLFSQGCVEIDRMLGFRDWLRAHPKDLDLYARTKHDLSQRHWKYVQNYADAKTTIVREIMQRAGLASAAEE